MSLVVGFDRAGHPLVETTVNHPNYYGGWSNLWVVSGLGQAETIASASPAYGGPNFNWSNFESDPEGLWFGGNRIYLVVVGQGAYSMSNYSATLAGPCQ